MRSRPAAPGNASPSNTLAPGTLLASRYQIEELIATGGMGAVYRARDRRFRAVVRRCAVKEMFDAIADIHVRQRAVEHFEREANLLASLDHQAIPKVFDYFTEGERHYLVYEFVDGQDLARVLYQRSRPLTPERVVDWAIQLTHVLEGLHRNEPPIVFRDLKPSNVMLRPDGHIVLVDFGIAKHFQPAHRGTMIGTEGYAPPEQYEGMADPQVDIYALGASMHQLLTNTDPQEFRPFSFDQRPIRQYNSNVPNELDGIVMRALSYEASDRWESMQALRHALEVVQQRLTGVSAQTPRPHAAPSRPLRSPGGRGTGLFARHMQEKLDEGTRALPNTPSDDGASASDPVTVPIGALGPSPVRGMGGTVSLQSEAVEGEAALVPSWSFATEDEVRSTPVFYEDSLFIGSYDTNLYCLDAQTGDFRWKYATGAGVPGTPTVWRDLVFIGSEDFYVYALDRQTGHLEWSAATQGRVRSSPRVANDHVIVGSDDGQVYAWHAARGTLAWRFNMAAPVRSTPAVSEEMLFVGAEDGTVQGLDLMMGESRWRIHAGGSVISSPVIAGERVIFGSMDRQMYGADMRSGWVVWRTRLNDRIYSSPHLWEGQVFVASVDGTLYSLDAEWGKEVWKLPLGTQVTSSPVVNDEGKLFVGGVNGALYCCDARKGKLLWKFGTGGAIPGSPRLREGLVYFGSMDHRVYALPVAPSAHRI